MQTDVTTAQDRFRELVRDYLGPLLRNLGFQGSGQDLVLPDAHHWALLGIQRSRWSDSEALDFTIQLTVANRKTWEDLRTQHNYPERPYSTRFYGPRIWQKRLGDLMPGGSDKWWQASSDTDVKTLAVELGAAIEQYGLPAMRVVMAAGAKDPLNTS